MKFVIFGSRYMKLFFRDLFLISFVSFVLFFLSDLAKPGFVTNYISINGILLLVLFLGVVTVFLWGSEN